jgi:hypothetical protein
MRERWAIVGVVIILPLCLGLSQCDDDTIRHKDLVAAAEAVGEQCDPPNPQRVSICGDITFVDGDSELARLSYEGRCLGNDPTVSGSWVWYEEDDWEFEAFSTITQESVRVISERLGVDARDCLRDQG